MFFNIFNNFFLEIGSTPVVGSSKNSKVGEPIKDIAQQSFLLLPPLRFFAFIVEY